MEHKYFRMKNKILPSEDPFESTLLICFTVWLKNNNEY